MSRLVSISEAVQRPPLATVIFVHGLGGDARTTWRSRGDESLFWPRWLGESVEDIDVLSLDYDAEPSAWLGPTMPLVERARNVLTHLELVDGPLIFVCHSLGGLVIKEALRVGGTLNITSWADVATRTKGIVFLATPHAGSKLAKSLDNLRTLFRISTSVRELEQNTPHLLDLHDWFTNNHSGLDLATLTFYENKPTALGIIVDRVSANPHVPGARFVALDADHQSICKPQDKAELVVASVTAFVRALLETRATGPTGAAEVEDKQRRWLARVMNRTAQLLEGSSRLTEDLAEICRLKPKIGEAGTKAVVSAMLELPLSRLMLELRRLQRVYLETDQAAEADVLWEVTHWLAPAMLRDVVMSLRRDLAAGNTGAIALPVASVTGAELVLAGLRGRDAAYLEWSEKTREVASPFSLPLDSMVGTEATPDGIANAALEHLCNHLVPKSGRRFDIDKQLPTLRTMLEKMAEDGECYAVVIPASDNESDPYCLAGERIAEQVPELVVVLTELDSSKFNQETGDFWLIGRRRPRP